MKRGISRRLIAGAFGDNERLKRLVAVAIGLPLAISKPNEADARPARKPTLTWGVEGSGASYVIVQHAKPRERISSLLKRARLRYRVNPLDPGYVLEIAERRRGGRVLRSQYWLAGGQGDYDPPPGIPCLQLELGHWDGSTWTLVEQPEWPLLKMAVSPGLDVRILQEGFDGAQVALGVLDMFHIAWVTARRKSLSRVRSLWS